MVIVENLLIRCSNQNITQSQHQLREIGNPDTTTMFKQHNFLLCLTIVPGGRLERVKTKLRLPHFSTLYKNCRLYRLELIIREGTRLLAHNHEIFTPGDKKKADYFSPPQSLADLLTCTAVSYLSSQSIQFTSLLDTNQEAGVVSHPLILS